MSAAARFVAIDGLRGLIMVLMALDHAWVFLTQSARQSEYWVGPLPIYADAASALVRLVSHLCAPGFFLLLGCSVPFLVAGRSARGWSARRIDRHLVVRGLVLIGLQVVAVSPAWLLSGNASGAGSFTPGDGSSTLIYWGVLAGLGGCLALCSLLRRLPSWALALLAAGLIAGLPLLAPTLGEAARAEPYGLRILLLVGKSSSLAVKYPLAGWIGIVAIGIVAGRWMREAPALARGRIFGLGLACVALFVTLRAFGLGDPQLQPQGALAFINLTKYPPSTAFILLYGGANLVILGALMGRGGARMPRWLVTLGQAALFFYVVHLYLYGVTGRAILTATGSGLELGPALLVVWVLGVAALLWPSAWWTRFKRSRPPESPVRML